MAKGRDQDEPGRDAIPAELLLGREEPSAEGEAAISETLAEPANRTRTSRAKPTRGDRAFIAGLVAVLATGGALYLWRDDLEAQYERRFHPKRYWAAEVDAQRFSIKHSELLHRECLVDLSAARAKEPIRVAMSELLGIASSNARTWAMEDTVAQEQTCADIAAMVKRDQERLIAAEQELARVHPR